MAGNICFPAATVMMTKAMLHAMAGSTEMPVCNSRKCGCSATDLALVTMEPEP